MKPSLFSGSISSYVAVRDAFGRRVSRRLAGAQTLGDRVLRLAGVVAVLGIGSLSGAAWAVQPERAQRDAAGEPAFLSAFQVEGLRGAFTTAASRNAMSHDQVVERQGAEGIPGGEGGRLKEPSHAAGTSRSARAGRQALPVWELGLGVSALSLADYRGADTRQRYLLPFPVVVYRAPHLKMDRSGLRADLWDDDRYELDLSVAVTPPVKRRKTGIRAGMPGRKALLELGPRLQGWVWSGDQGRQRLKWHLPLRYAMPLGKLENAGLVFHPKLVLDIDNVGGWRGWQFSLAAGPIFANRAHHRYYYEVAPAYARPGRHAWAARGGYGGMQYTASFNKRFPDYWVAGFVRLDQVQGAVFASSPLVRQKRQLSAGLVFGWLFARSAERVFQSD